MIKFDYFSVLCDLWYLIPKNASVQQHNGEWQAEQNFAENHVIYTSIYVYINK